MSSEDEDPSGYWAFARKKLVDDLQGRQPLRRRLHAGRYLRRVDRLPDLGLAPPLREEAQHRRHCLLLAETRRQPITARLL
jgi:hypothetical protein